VVTGSRRAGGAGARCLVALAVVAVVVAACGSDGGSDGASRSTTRSTVRSTTPTVSRPPAGAGSSGPAVMPARRLGAPLPAPGALAPFTALAALGEGQWHPAGRLVGGVAAVYETTLVPPGGTEPVGVAWMDTHLLAARLYSGSASPGGGPFRYSAPIGAAEATTLVAAFNGGFLMDTASGGYVTEGRVVVPLVAGAASLVLRVDGTVDVGAWGTDVTMTPDVVAVRQNLVPLVADGHPTAPATGPDWEVWGNTCGATSCAHSVPGVEHQWRSGAGVTADGALVYVTGPLLSPAQLAEVLAHAGAVRAMELDINPSWTVLVTYDPLTPGGAASPDDGTRLVPGTVQGPATFFDPAWARDFVTLSARPVPAGGRVPS
jgi:hypothetical protein